MPSNLQSNKIIHIHIQTRQIPYTPLFQTPAKMMPQLTSALTNLALVATAVTAHYANMGLEGVDCYIYNGIKGTTQGHMIIQNANLTWFDNDDKANRGSVTVIHSQQEYDQLPVKTKVGIVCAPDIVSPYGIGIPYVEMEPTDEDFYGDAPTVFEPVPVHQKPYCIFQFCRNHN